MLSNRFKTFITVTCMLSAAAVTCFAEADGTLADREYAAWVVSDQVPGVGVLA